MNVPHRALDVTAGVGGEESDNIGDLLARRRPPKTSVSQAIGERLSVLGLLVSVFEDTEVPAAADQTRRDGIDTDAVLRHLQRHTAGECLDAGLAGRVHRGPGPGE